MRFKFQRADRMRDPFDRVRYRMREIVHRIDAPGIAGAMMRHVQNPVQHGVPHHEVRRRHVDLGAQYFFAVGVAPLFHFLK